VIHQIKKRNDKNHTIISVDVEKAFDKLSIHDKKILNKVGLEETSTYLRPYMKNPQLTSYTMVKN